MAPIAVAPARPRLRGSSARVAPLLIAIGLSAGSVVSPALATSTMTAGSHDGTITGLLSRVTAPLPFRFGVADTVGPRTAGLAPAVGFDATLLGPSSATEATGSALLGRYRMALERESRRLLERDPSLLRAETMLQEGYPSHNVQRQATRIFQGANSRMLSQMVEQVLEEAASLHHARAYFEGVRLDLMSGGGLRIDPSRPEREARGSGDGADEVVAASFSLVVVGRPRLEMRAVLPGGIHTRVEVPLASPGVRTMISRRITSNLRGTLSGGMEDSGSDRWVSAGLAIRF